MTAARSVGSTTATDPAGVRAPACGPPRSLGPARIGRAAGCRSSSSREKAGAADGAAGQCSDGRRWTGARWQRIVRGRNGSGSGRPSGTFPGQRLRQPVRQHPEAQVEDGRLIGSTNWVKATGRPPGTPLIILEFHDRRFPHILLGDFSPDVPAETFGDSPLLRMHRPGRQWLRRHILGCMDHHHDLDIRPAGLDLAVPRPIRPSPASATSITIRSGQRFRLGQGLAGRWPPSLHVFRPCPTWPAAPSSCAAPRVDRQQ